MRGRTENIEERMAGGVICDLHIHLTLKTSFVHVHRTETFGEEEGNVRKMKATLSGPALDEEGFKNR